MTSWLLLLVKQLWNLRRIGKGQWRHRMSADYCNIEWFPPPTKQGMAERALDNGAIGAFVQPLYRETLAKACLGEIRPCEVPLGSPATVGAIIIVFVSFEETGEIVCKMSDLPRLLGK